MEQQFCFQVTLKERNYKKKGSFGQNENRNRTKVMNYAHGVVYSIQNYVIKFFSDLRQVSGFLWIPPPIKLTI